MTLKTELFHFGEYILGGKIIRKEECVQRYLWPPDISVIGSCSAVGDS